jgi:hypothetical protein
MKKFKQTYKRYFESRAEQYILPLIKQHGAYLFFIVKGTTGQSVDEKPKPQTMRRHQLQTTQ